MAITATGVAIAGLIVGAAGTRQSIQAGKAAATSQRRSGKAAQRIQEVKAARERRQQAAAARVARAEIVSQTSASGVAGSSSAISAAGDVGAQSARNESFLNNVGSLTQQQSIFNQKAITAGNKANTASAVAGLGFTAASQAGGFESIFKTTP